MFQTPAALVVLFVGGRARREGEKIGFYGKNRQVLVMDNTPLHRKILPKHLLISLATPLQTAPDAPDEGGGLRPQHRQPRGPPVRDRKHADAPGAAQEDQRAKARTCVVFPGVRFVSCVVPLLSGVTTANGGKKSKLTYTKAPHTFNMYAFSNLFPTSPHEKRPRTNQILEDQREPPRERLRADGAREKKKAHA